MNSLTRLFIVVLAGVAIVAAGISLFDAPVSGAEAATLQDEAAAAPAPEEKKEEKKEEEESPEEAAAKRASLERKLNIAKMKLEVAAMDLESQNIAADLSVRHAREELEIARTKMDQFLSIDSKNKLDSARMSLQFTRDRAQEAAEELAQIEIMYEDQDLDDRTAEFVVSRGRRNAERAAQRIAIEERSLVALEKHELPREMRTMQLDIERKEAAVDKAARDARSGEMQKRISILSAESEVVNLEEEMRKLDKKASEK